MKAVLQYRASTGFRRQLEASRPDWLEVAVVDENDHERFLAEMQDAEVLLHVLEPVTRPVLEHSPRLRLIQKIGVGVNTIDLETARERGIRVANMPGTNAQAVAELTLHLMLELLRRVRHFHALTQSGKGWQTVPDDFDGLGELCGATIGLVGYGDTARPLAAALSVLGARIIYTARSPKPDAIGDFASLDELLACADIVSVHLGLNDETRGLFDARRFAQMKRGASFVNVARGPLVQEAALVDALRSGHLAGAALDVFAQEPTPAENPLLHMENVVVLPHIAWLTPQTLQRSIGVAFENCRRLREGENLLHPVV